MAPQSGAKQATSTVASVAPATVSCEFVESSGVLFDPSKQHGLWKIGRKWYDLSPFLDRHPGGRQILELSRDRFEDSTFAFESFHMDQPAVRKMLLKYAVAAPTAAADPAVGPLLSPLDGFYGVLRAQVNTHLAENGGKGPTFTSVALYHITLVVWLALHALVLVTGCQTWPYTGPLVLALHIVASGILGGYGHNWVHQPQYRSWATLSLDLVGFSSENWYVPPFFSLVCPSIYALLLAYSTSPY